MRVGAKVTVERDEKQYPPRGTWKQFRGKRGTVVSINGDEFGVVFGKVWRCERTNRIKWSGDEPITWFLRHEVRERN